MKAEVMFASINGIQIYYQKSGEGYPLILLHGNSQDHTFFDDLINQLANQYTVYALDSRGHGKSSITPKLKHSDMVEDIAYFIQELGLEKPILCGSSDGGVIGLMLAARYPGILSKLVVCGANSKVEGLKAWFVNTMRFCYSLSIKSKNPKNIVMTQKLGLILDQPEITKADLQQITVPTLVLAGSRDLVKDGHTREMAACITDHSLFVLKGETHTSYIKNSSKLCTVMLPFLEYKPDSISE